MGILVFSAHPEDEMLGISGILLGHMDSGDEVYWALYTFTIPWIDDDTVGYRRRMVDRVADACVNITLYIERKLEMLSIFEDQIHDCPHARSIEGVRVYAMYRGNSVGLKYAETLMPMRVIR